MAADYSESVLATFATPPALDVAGGPAVTEGAAATFTFTISSTRTTATTINYHVAESGQNAAAAGELGFKTETLPPNTASVSISVLTYDDTHHEAPGQITVSISGGDYVVRDGSASVAVSDNTPRRRRPRCRRTPCPRWPCRRPETPLWTNCAGGCPAAP